MQGCPDPPPNWTTERRKERLRRILKLTLAYLRREDIGWPEIAKSLKKTSGKGEISHQYVSQLLNEGMRYLLDHQWVVEVSSGQPITRMSGNGRYDFVDKGEPHTA